MAGTHVRCKVLAVSVIYVQFDCHWASYEVGRRISDVDVQIHVRAMWKLHVRTQYGTHLISRADEEHLIIPPCVTGFGRWAMSEI